MAFDIKNIMNDWMKSIEESVCGFLKQIIEASLNTSQDLLLTGMNSNKKGLFSTFLTSHPANFDGTLDGSGGTTIWTTIEKLCNTAIVPLGGFVLVVILLNDLIQQCIAGNNFRDFDTSIIFKWVFKCLCGIILISNVFYITSAFISFGSQATSSAMTAIFGSADFIAAKSEIIVDAKDMGIGELAVILLMSGMFNLVVIAMLVIMIIVMASRMIEIFMYLAIAPIPISTMMDSDWGSIGKNWIKSVFALAFQGMFIVVALSIFQTMFKNIITNLSKGNTVMMQMVILMGYSVALCFTILKTGSISKSVFNAH
jgi:hypothetical protein